MKAPQKRTNFPSAAGILAIAASLIMLYISVFFLWGSLQTWEFTHAAYFGWGVLGVSFYYDLATGIFGVISFPFGLASGIFVSRRKRIKFSVFGLSLPIICGAMIFLRVFMFGLSILSDIFLLSLFSLPILVPSVLAIILVSLSKAEFN